ncbi:MAG: BMP family ABC transporter substrate-binding protein [Actinobacteria bacterium]|nr:BMP family ABC transporter substrate-binding protein [Actinomycetota bacterium]
MRIRTTGAIAGVAALALALTACGGGSTPTAAPGTEQPATSPGAAPSGDLLSIANVVNGGLGDQGFFDDAQRGIDALAAAGHKTETLQAAVDNPAQWKANLESVSTGDWGLVITGTSQMVDILAEAAPKFPDQKYIIYDSVVEAPNVASITYKQNEGSFLAGVLAGLVTTSQADFPLAGQDKIVGAVGGMDIPVINDFFVGYEAGVKAVDPEIKVLTSYVGDFANSQKGYDQAKAMYDQGANVVFQVAGGAGIGVLQAAKDANKYAIGVDANQNQLQPGHILASMLKNIGVSLEQAVASAQDGSLQYGTTAAFGLANDGVGLDFDDNEGIVPQTIIDKIGEYKQQVVDGTLEVPTKF